MPGDRNNTYKPIRLGNTTRQVFVQENRKLIGFFLSNLRGYGKMMIGDEARLSPDHSRSACSPACGHHCPCASESRQESAVAEPARARWRCGFKRRCPCVVVTLLRRCLDVAIRCCTKMPFLRNMQFHHRIMPISLLRKGLPSFFGSRECGWQRVRMLLVVRPKCHYRREMQRWRRSLSPFAVF